MPGTRPRRIVRRAVMALVVVVLLSGAWLSIGEPPEIERSRAIKLGTPQPQVEEAMGGTPTTATMSPSNGEMVLYFGQPTSLFDLKWKVLAWLGLRTPSRLDNYPVRVHLDSKGRVVQIERGHEVEE